MSLKFSQGVVNSIAMGQGWGEVIKNGKVVVYSGSQPTSPETAATAGTELVSFTTSGGTLTPETRANCRIAFTGGTLAVGDTISLEVGGVTVGSFTGVSGSAATVAAPALANAINSTWSFPDYYAVPAGTTVGSITYGASANAANEVFVIAPKNSGAVCNALTANVTGNTANAAFAINGHTANTATNFANAAHGGGGTSANGLGIAAANGISCTYPAANGVISKSNTWSGTSSANGTAGWFRILCTPNYDTGLTNLSASSNDAKLIMRIDGTVGTSSADMLVTSTTITANVAQTASSFSLTVPSA